MRLDGTATVDGVGAEACLLLVRRVVGCGAGQHRPRCVDHDHLAVQHLAYLTHDVIDPTPAQHDAAEPVVGVGGPFDAVMVGLELFTGRLELGEGGLSLGEQASVVDGDRRVCRQRYQQRHLFAGERPRRSIGGVQNSEHLPTHQQRHADDRDQFLFVDRTVDVTGVAEALIVEIVRSGVGPCGLRDETAEAGPHRKPQRAELLREDAVGHPHVGVARASSLSER